MAEWVALRPILKVYDKETGYGGGGAPGAVELKNSYQEAAE